MEHPNATRIRTMWQAANAGDQAVADELVADDIVWSNDIGASPWREVVGKQACLGFALAWQELFDFTFAYDVLDACGSDASVVLVLREHGTARGHHFDNQALYYFTLDPDGKVARIQTYDRDREAIDAFWDAVGPVDTSPTTTT
jgi:ketosteroid isomerase-like protein